MAVWWDIYNLLPFVAGTDEYYCSEESENKMAALCRQINDFDLHGVLAKFWNEKKRWPTISVKNEALQARFDRLIPVAKEKTND